MDSSLPHTNASSNDATDVDRLARTVAGPLPVESLSDDAAAYAAADAAGSWDKLGATRVTEASTDSPDLTPPAGVPVPVNKPMVGGTLGDFHLLEKLGEGAMGAVYRARQISFDRIVALKVLFGHIASQPRLVERLYREGRALAQLDHENIVQAHGFGEVSGCHFVAMEFIEGKNLQAWLRRLGKLSVPDALTIARAVARGLEHSHAKGIVHRDVKPENILISPTGQIKLVDLGMVKSEDDDMSLTMTGHAIGTPWYMPLEQAKNAKETDARSDIYSLGCCLYCLLTGRPPFQGKTLVDVIQAKERGTFPSARSHNRDVPERLDLVLVKMLAKSPAQRYQTCTELIRDLEKLGLAGTRLSFLGYLSDNFDTPTPVVTKTVVEKPDFDPNVWFVKVPMAPGKYVVQKLTTEQVRPLLTGRQLEPTAHASHDPKQGFRALYKEFAGVSSRVTRPIDRATTTKYQELYRKIEEVEDSREGAAQAKDAIVHSNTRYYLSFAKYPLIAAGVATLAWWLVNR